MDKKTLQSILSKPFELSDWRNLLTAVFGVKNFLTKPSEIPLSSNKKAESAFELGSFNTADDRIIGLYLVKVKPEVWLERNKVGLRELLRSVYKYDVDGALIVFEQADKWRLSFVSEIRTFDEEGNIAKKITEPKRYTYLLGKGEKTKTPVDRLFAFRGKKLYLEDIRNLFSVSTLTKEFYNELFKWYEWTLSEEVGVSFPRNTHAELDNREKLEEQIIRLITRLLFVWFIKQKKLVPNNLFDKDEVKKILKDFNPTDSKNGNYYNAILQNLFFATLNKSVTERAFAKEENTRDIKTLYRYAEMFSINEKEVLELFSKIPFLNGGLFECLDKETSTDGVKYHIDGFSRNDRKVKGQFSHRAFIPNCVFFDEEKGIIPLLERYNFTVEENAPEDVQVALDPELLGNVFENLLGAFNNETKESARKQSGSFYTPREIVDFMVSESLQAYLKEKIGDVDLNGELSDVEKKKIYNTLLKVKILDPACGSGAFPMGILNGIIALLEKIGVAETLDMYKLKLHLIENCIYGVDLQTIASQISKLRFFISLIVEQGEMNLNKENYGVITLPNLETKFVAANTLLGLHKKQAQGNLFEDPAIETTKQEILNVRHEHFYAQTAKEKRQLREKDEKLRNKLVKLLEANHEFAPEDAKQVAQWNPYDQNSSSPFFDAEWKFGLKDGFDIVIGNPPYLRIQGIRDSNPKLADALIKNYKSASGSFDLYVTFVEKSLSLTKSNGLVNFIMPTKWTNAAFGKGLREVISEKSAANKIINFGAYQVFNASTYTGIHYFKVNSDEMLYYELDRDLKSNEELAKYLKSLSPTQGTLIAKEKLTKEIWTLTAGETSKIIDKLNLQPRRISDVFDKIFQGLATSKDDVYFLYDCVEEKDKVVGFSKQLDKTIQIEREFVKPLLKGEDVHRYDHITTNRFVVFPYKLEKGNAELYKEAEIKEQFPLAYAYLKECEDILRDREKGRLKNDTFWYRYIYPKNLTLFTHEKLVAPEISMGGNFSYDKNGRFYSSTTIYGYIKKKDVKDSYKSLLAILNSQLFWWYLVNTGTVLTNGYFRFKTNYILPFPMPVISNETILFLEKSVDKILETKAKDKNANIKEFEETINEIVYSLYNLTSEEIELIQKV